MPKRKPSQRRHPEKTPQQPRDRLAEIRAEIQDVQQQIETKRRDGRVIRTAEDFKSLECAIAALTNRLSALLMAEATQVALDDSENRRQARSLAQGAGHAIKDQGRRDVTLRTTCGQVIVRATYFSRNCDRSKASKGMYPMLLLWGVHDRCTAAIVSEISKLVAMLSSLEEVEQVLSDRGRPLDYKTIRTIAYRFATRARAAQRVGALNWGETVAGRRVVVSTDGGRIRIRTTKRGPKTAKGRNRYRTDWREPKLLIIYVVDEKGQMDREFLAVIDGTLGGPDAIFKLMEFSPDFGGCLNKRFTLNLLSLRQFRRDRRFHKESGFLRIAVLSLQGSPEPCRERARSWQEDLPRPPIRRSPEEGDRLQGSHEPSNIAAI